MLDKLWLLEIATISFNLARGHVRGLLGTLRLLQGMYA